MGTKTLASIGKTSPESSSRIGRTFARLRAARRAGLIAYLTAGDPSPKHTPRLAAALERGGADLIELGVPFSDPIADGPVIQRASERALRAGMTLRGVLEIAGSIRERSEIPIILFTYLNPVVRYGFEALARDAAARGIDGCLLTDLSVEEADTYVRALRAKGLDTIFLAAPTSTERRLRLVAEYSSGFVYVVSRTGVTGEQSSVSEAVGPLIEKLRGVTRLPLAVGFGISTVEQARQVGGLADGVVVGSAVVRTIEQNAESPDLEARVEALARELRSGL
ncbi:MAG TPA: tryptophan synthase subunit alpha [Bryobacteraceae bacterium]|nr:tryptophan synthase subunit alpha [Bryobacteraceae bacterium]